MTSQGVLIACCCACEVCSAEHFDLYANTLRVAWNGWPYTTENPGLCEQWCHTGTEVITRNGLKWDQSVVGSESCSVCSGSPLPCQCQDNSLAEPFGYDVECRLDCRDLGGQIGDAWYLELRQAANDATGFAPQPCQAGTCTYICFARFYKPIVDCDTPPYGNYPGDYELDFFTACGDGLPAFSIAAV